MRGARVGAETVTVARNGDGWLISSSGRLLSPIDLTTTRFEVAYGGDWQPQRLVLEGTLAGRGIMLTTTFGVTTATNEFLQGQQRGSNTQQVSPRAVVLPENFFGAYEALATRLTASTAGARIPIYIAPEGEVSAVVDRVTPRRIALPERTVDIREYSITITHQGGLVPVMVWADDRGRLARLVLPTTSLVVVREDLAAVMAREERSRNQTDEDLFIPASGFSLGATISRPVEPVAKAPAVILVAGPGPQDRDHTTFGVSVFAQLAGQLADAGYFVVRYDGRGVGRSGGRTESAALAEYAGDVLDIVSWLRKRKDVDDNRIVVVGYGEGGPVALTAARRQDDIRGITLLAAPGKSGRDVTLEQQDRLLARLPIPEAERASKAALQLRIIDAALTGNGWEAVSPDVRRQADSPWFRSWLLFDPGAVIRRINRPLLILTGALDTEFAPAHANQLADAARARKVSPAYTRVTIVPSVNHLLTPATTGSTDEYQALPSLTIAPEIANEVVQWLKEVLPAR